MAPIEFKARRDAQGNMSIMCHREVKPNGDVVMHAPSLKVIGEFMKKNG